MSKCIEFLFYYPRDPSIVLFEFFPFEAVAFSFSILIFILSPCVLNCLSRALMNFLSSSDNPVNSSKMDFGCFVGFRDDAFLIDLCLSDDFAATIAANRSNVVCELKNDSYF